MPSPLLFGRPRFEVGDIVRTHGRAFAAQTPLRGYEARALSDMGRCRTAELGGHLDVCRDCGYAKPAYNSCRNRHCPKCQALAQERWIHAREQRLLPVPHFHVVFTLPAELRALTAFRREPVFGALIQAATQTLLELGRSRLGADLGITAVLHTWTRDLRFHPHLHCVVTGGGLARGENRWVSSTRYLFPVRQMAALFRAKMLGTIGRLRDEGIFVGFHQEPEAFQQCLDHLTRTRWLVYAKKSMSNETHVVRYLGRYTHRVGIANSRLVDAQDHAITFRTKNGECVTLEPLEFLRRLAQHILPPRFVRIRHFGLYASGNVNTKLELARRLIEAPMPLPVAKPLPTNALELLLLLTGRDPRRCPDCGGSMIPQPLPLEVQAPVGWDSS